jgi:urocanate hydratase
MDHIGGRLVAGGGIFGGLLGGVAGSLAGAKGSGALWAESQKKKMLARLEKAYAEAQAADPQARINVPTLNAPKDSKKKIKPSQK